MNNLKFLIADDAPTVRRFISYAIKNNFSNVEIDYASHGKEAMEKMEANNYDLVLCDWKMPHVSGIELLEWIRNHPDLKSTPFILITANNDRDSIIKANELGVDDYILKPLTVENLIEKLSSIINLKLSKAHE